jgi:hypothetical protein
MSPNSNAHVLPDSRMKDPVGTVMVNWEFEEVELVGNVFKLVKKKYRLEMEQIFCVNCGCTQGWIPRGLFAWICFLCDDCSAKYGKDAANYLTPDAEFWNVVREEMVKAYGRPLTQQELAALVERNELTPALKLLERESPYPKV